MTRGQKCRAIHGDTGGECEKEKSESEDFMGVVRMAGSGIWPSDQEQEEAAIGLRYGPDEPAFVIGVATDLVPGSLCKREMI